MEKYNKTMKILGMKRGLRILGFIFITILISSCSKKIVFPVSQVVPAAEAVLKVDQDDNNNYEIDLEVSNLAEPDRLTPARKHYVVWMVTKKQGTINIGNLEIDRKNSGKLSTTSPYEPTRIFITAEDDPNPVIPSTQVVLNSEDFKV